MDPIEQRVREALHARAQDAEPTPHLYRGVQARIARRRRRQVLAWVPAGAAALGVAVAVPMLLTGGPEVPDIADYADRQPLSPAAPDRAVVYDGDGGLGILDLRDGTITDSGAQTPPQGRLSGLAVPAGDRGADPAWVALEQLPGAGPGWTIFRPGVSEVSAGFPGVVGDGGMAVDDDGGWVAYLTEAEEADGYVLTVASTLLDGEMEIHTLGNVSEDARVLDWGGPTDGSTGTASEILVATANGTLTGFEVVWTDGVPTAVGDGATVEREAEVLAASLTHDGTPTPTASRYQLEQDGERRVVRLVGDVTGASDVTALVGDAAPADLWLDAWRDATLLGDGASVWLLRHDGDGGFATPVALPDGTVRAALVGRALPAEPDDGSAPTDDPAPAEDPAVEEPADEPTVATGSLGDGLVVADDRTVSLVRPDGSQQELVTFPAEGESAVVDVAVRPGSTTADLTVAVTTRAEAMFDVRWFRAVDGVVDQAEGFPALPIEGAGGFPVSPPDLLDGAVPAAVWSPEGDLLAVAVRPAEDAPTEIRTIGWDEDGPSDDPNLAATFQLGVQRPLTAHRWVWTDGADGVARSGHLLLVDRLGREAFNLPIERQGDGAPALPGADPEQPEGLDQGDVLALEDADGDGSLETILYRTDAGPVLELAEWQRDGEERRSIPLETTGPRQVDLLVASEQVILVVLDPAQPILVDRVTGEVTPAPIDGEVVAADLIR
jgi:hypothetical protein